MRNIIEKLRNWFRKENEIPALTIYNFNKLKEFQELFNSKGFDVKKFEALEFIGDRLINFIIANLILEIYPTRAFYSNFRNTVFSNNFFEKVVSANKIRKLYDCNRINKNAGDVLECMCAMVYHKEGFEKTCKIFRRLIEPTLRREAKFISERHWYFILKKYCKENLVKYEIESKLKTNKELYQAMVEIWLFNKKKAWFGFSPDRVDAEEAACQQAYRWLVKQLQPVKRVKKEIDND